MAWETSSEWSKHWMDQTNWNSIFMQPFRNQQYLEEGYINEYAKLNPDADALKYAGQLATASNPAHMRPGTWGVNWTDPTIRDRRTGRDITAPYTDFLTWVGEKKAKIAALPGEIAKAPGIRAQTILSEKDNPLSTKYATTVAGG